jgi:ERCC4-type nuclease
MIFLDRREPPELAEAIRKHGVEVEHGPHIEFEDGDIVFEGNGEKGPGAMIAIERKKLTDLVNCMKDRRLAGKQLRGLQRTYDYIFLLCEGMWRCAEDGSGSIEVFGVEKKKIKGNWVSKRGWVPYYSHVDKRSVNHRQITSFIHSLSLRGRTKSTGEAFRLIRTAGLEESAAWIVSLYYNFTEKEWGQHHAHDQIYSPIPPKGHGYEWGKVHGHNTKYSRAVMAANGDPTTVWRAAAQLPGVDRRATDVAAAFRTIRGMALAGLEPGLRRRVERWFADNPSAAVDAWMELDGFGIVKAEAAVRAIAVEGA